MQENELDFKLIRPDALLSDFVDSFWMLANQSDHEKDIVVLPDGRIDITFSYYATKSFHGRLVGLATQAAQTAFPPKTAIFAISLNPLAVDYLLQTSVSDLVNKARPLPDDFWDIQTEDLVTFEHFCATITLKINERLNDEVDERKRKLFSLIDSSNGSLPVNAISEQVSWSSRQINRYFNRQFGLSLKAYCTILRFRASFQHIREGHLFPEQNYVDQAHFIRDVKKFSGVVPKILYRNPNDRFIQFSV